MILFFFIIVIIGFLHPPVCKSFLYAAATLAVNGFKCSGFNTEMFFLMAPMC